jgi:hypothetical protein
MQMRLLIGAYLGLRRLLTIRYPKGSKPRRYIFMWIVGALKVESTRYHKHVMPLIFLP